MRKVAYRFAIVLLLATLGACSSTRVLDDPNAGRTQRYEAGLPDFDMEALGTVENGKPGINVRLGLPYASLVFVADTIGYTGRFEVLLHVIDEVGRQLSGEVDADHMIKVATYQATQAYTPVLIAQRLDAKPGRYVVEAVVTDAESGQSAVRRQRVDVVGSESSRPSLSDIWMRQKPPGDSFEPMLALFTPTGMDSLRAGIQLVNAGRLGEVAVGMRLLQFERDTTIAQPPQGFPTSRGSMAYFGIEPFKPDTLYQTQRLLVNPDTALDLIFDLPALGEGTYRIEVEARKAASAGEERLLRGRTFTITNAHFPRLSSLDQLIDASAYLATRREYEQIQDGETLAAKKARFDAFWAEIVPNRQAAANLIERYYSRVESANLRFSSFKEGWKTDRGMVYIILGEPLFVDVRLDGETWHYSYDEQEAVSTYHFERVRHPAGLFDNFVLQRRTGYDATWRRAVDRWRRGEGY